MMKKNKLYDNNYCPLGPYRPFHWGGQNDGIWHVLTTEMRKSFSAYESDEITIFPHYSLIIDNDQRHENSQAKAYLFSAAPELFDACLRATIQMLNIQSGITPTQKEMEHTIAFLQAALKKASYF